MMISRHLLGDRPAALAARDLTWGVDRSEPIISGISFDVAPGETLAVVGPNGAGKSSLLRCLYRYHRPTTGTASLDGQDLWSLSARDCARRVATVLQEPASDFGLTVAEIIELGLTPHRRSWARTDYEPVEDALALMQLTHLAGRDLATLSGGEKQRVMVARALVQKPDLLILDEPTNHLDIRHQLEVLAMLRALPVTVVVSIHDLALASSHADSVLVLHAGRMAAFGAPLDVLTPAAISSTFAVGTSIDRHPVTGQPRFSFHLNDPETAGDTYA
ncbi:ATP-binding cassette domain-containing protein [Aurantimonas aggregata]|uniref:ATP-binding cassette domain-containing protein n=1 Tax=Aurantimonas aggregata TaxID=2047720 RepID=A0A6L9MGQ5_9HYPH|nr:ABC transporter ATP-binding protein [Aurantimonas aggregata]NDV86838.1 ATP-binding cassette domain-containing protein [Aurantimonas aggregata]